MRFLTLILKNVWQRKVRSFLTCIGMAVAVCAVITMVSVADVYEQAVTTMLQARGVDLVVTRDTPQKMLGVLPEPLGDRFRQLPDVLSVEPMLIDLVSFPEANLVAVYVFGWSVDGTMFDQLSIAVGRKLQPGDRGKVVLGGLVAQNLNKQVGDTVDIEGENLEVVGICRGGNLFENAFAVVALADLQQLMDRPNQVTGFMIRMTESDDKQARLDSLKRQIEAMADEKGRRYLDAKATVEHVSGNLELKVFQGMAWTTSAIALVIGVIGMLNTMMISVFERTREIGTLRAVGWRKSRVVRMILLETMVLSVAGALVGTVMSSGLTWVLGTFPQASNLILPSNVNAEVVAKAFLLAVTAGLLGAVYPAFFAARLLPTEALRHE